MATSGIGARALGASFGVALAAGALVGCGTRRTAPEQRRGVLVDAQGIQLDGEHVADAPRDEILGIRPLARALAARVPSGATARPSGVPDSTPLDVRLPVDIACLAAMNVLFTAEAVGWRRVVVHIGGRSQPLELDGTSSDPMRRRLTLAFRGADRVAMTSTDCGGAYDVQPFAGAGASALELTKGPPVLDGPAQIRCEPGIRFVDVLDVFVKTRPTETSAMAALRCAGRAPERDYLQLSGPDPLLRIPSAPEPKGERWWTRHVGPMAPDASKLDRDSVRAREATAAGALAADAVDVVLKPRLPLVARCFAAGLAASPDLGGRVEIRLEIGKTGEVMTALDAESSLPDRGVVGCILGQLAEASFPPSAGSTIAGWSLRLRPP